MGGRVSSNDFRVCIVSVKSQTTILPKRKETLGAIGLVLGHIQLG